jgi:glycine cleavage system H lipoate-binding protein
MSDQTGKKSASGPTAGELMKCVWMISGTINYKLCDRQYECEACPFDVALRQKPAVKSLRRSVRRVETLPVKENSRSSWPSNSLASSWMHGCNYSEGLFYHPSHFWARVEEGGSVRVGLDDFGQKLLGRVYSVGLPEVSSKCNMLDPCLRIAHQNGEVSFQSPLPGVVSEVNGTLDQRPSLINQDSYALGWLMVLQPDSLVESLKSFYYGQQAKTWFPEETLRLQHMLDELMEESRPDVGVTLQDGGLEIEELTKRITPAQHRQIIDTFMKNATAGRVS